MKTFLIIFYRVFLKKKNLSRPFSLSLSLSVCPYLSLSLSYSSSSFFHATGDSALTACHVAHEVQVMTRPALIADGAKMALSGPDGSVPSMCMLPTDRQVQLVLHKTQYCQSILIKIYFMFVV